MLHGPAYIVGQLLIDLGAVTEVADDDNWPISISDELPEPDNAVSIFDTQGAQHGSVQTDGEVQEHPGIMIRVRATGYQIGFAKASAIAELLDQSVVYETVTIEATDYIVHSINRTSNVLHLGKETPNSKRHLFTINATVALTQQA